jgi:hypothetical protein
MGAYATKLQWRTDAAAAISLNTLNVTSCAESPHRDGTGMSDVE